MNFGHHWIIPLQPRKCAGQDQAPTTISGRMDASGNFIYNILHDLSISLPRIVATVVGCRIFRGHAAVCVNPRVHSAGLDSRAWVRRHWMVRNGSGVGLYGRSLFRLITRRSDQCRLGVKSLVNTASTSEPLQEPWIYLFARLLPFLLPSFRDITSFPFTGSSATALPARGQRIRHHHDPACF